MGGGRGEYGVWEGGRGKSAAVFAFLGAESVANSWLPCLLGASVPGERAATSWFFAIPRRRCLEEPRNFFSGKTLRVRAPPRRASRFPVCHGLPRASQGTGNRGRALFVSRMSERMPFTMNRMQYPSQPPANSFVFAWRFHLGCRCHNIGVFRECSPVFRLDARNSVMAISVRVSGPLAAFPLRYSVIAIGTE